MARFRLTAGLVIGPHKLKAGSTIVESKALASPGDYIWTDLSSITVSPHMAPLDAAATTMLAASRFPSGVTVPYISGVNSID